MKNITWREQAQINALRNYIVMGAIQYMDTLDVNVAVAVSQSQISGADTDDDECHMNEQYHYECSECNDVTVYSRPLGVNYPFPRCLSEVCILKYIRNQ